MKQLKLIILFLLGFSVNQQAIAQDLLPNTPQVGGEVNAIAQDGTYTYIGGKFNFMGNDANPIYQRSGTFINQATGTFDNSFPDVNGSINAIEKDGSGGWYIGGFFTQVGGVARNNIAHINSDFTIDATWNPNADGEVEDIAVDGSNIYVGGKFTSIGGQTRARIAKLNNTDGSADTTWNPNADNAVYNVAILGTSVYAEGDFANIGGQARDKIAKLNKTDGTADGSWNLTADAKIYTLESDGNHLYIGGRFAMFGGNTIRGVARINTDGSLDLGWDPNVRISPGANDAGIVNSIAIDGTDIYLGGFFDLINSNTAVENFVRVNNTDGTIDGTWTPAVTDYSGDITNIATTYMGGIYVDATSVYIVGNFFEVNGASVNKFAKLNKTDGSEDLAFGTNFSTSGNAISGNSNGIYIAGNSGFIGGIEGPDHLLRYTTSTGIVDESWSPAISDGFVTVAFFSSYISAEISAIEIDGSDIYVGGQFAFIDGATRSGIMKLDATSGVDASWNADLGDINTYIYDIEVDGNDMYIGGVLSTVGGETRTGIAKINKLDASVDAGWNPNIVGTPIAYVKTIAIDNDDIYIGGNFNSADGQTRNNIAKLNKANGTVNLPWNPDADDWVNSIIAYKQDVYVGGNFNNIGGEARFGIAKLNTSDGSADPSWDASSLRYDFSIGSFVGGIVNTLDLRYPYLYTGGDFLAIGGAVRNKLARIIAIDGVTDADWEVSINDGDVASLLYYDSTLLVGGSFSSVISDTAIGFASFRANEQEFTEVDEAIACGSFYTSPSGNGILIEGSMLDTIPNTMGADSLLAISVTSEYNAFYTQDSLKDERVFDSDTLKYTIKTPYTAYSSFDNTNEDWVQINSVAPSIAGTNRSAFMWIKRNTISSSEILLGMNTAGGGNVCNLRLTNNGEISVFDGFTNRNSSTVVADGTWHHVGYTYNEATNETIIYADGIAVNNYSNGQTIDTDGQVSLGQEFDNSNTTGHYGGEMTEVSVWNEVLTEVEITAIMSSKIESNHPKYVNLVAYYPMLFDCGQVIADTLYDFSLNGFNGIASSADIMNVDSLTQINDFNSAGWYNQYWLDPENNTISTTDSLETASYESGNYKLFLLNRHFAITEEWEITKLKPFIATWQVSTDGEVMKIPTDGSGYDYKVKWGDGSVESKTTGNPSHTYATAGVYTVSIIGDFPHIEFRGVPINKPQSLLTIEQWGDIEWQSLEQAFFNCSNLEVNAIDTPNLTSVTSLRGAFTFAKAFNTDFTAWNVSNITNMAEMFRNTPFNQDISGWDVSNVKIMSSLFSNTPFNQDISGWDVSNVTDMGGLFLGDTVFNQNIGIWQVDSVTEVVSMFRDAKAFNQDISSWRLNRVTNMNSMFSGTTAFNQDIGGWDMSNVSYTGSMFYGATAFNQDIGGWDMSNVVGMDGMFYNATSFNQDVGKWAVDSVTLLSSIFYNASSFDQNLGSWDLQHTFMASNMFDGSGMSVENYDSTLIGWAAKDTIPQNLFFSAAGINYCTSATARQTLIDDHGWNITDAGEDCSTQGVTWTGSAWVPNAPTITDNVTIAGNYSVASFGGFTCANLTINSGDTLIIETNESITIAGNLINEGAMIVESDGAFVQTATSPSNSGSGNYISERIGANYHGQYNYWSSPVVNTTINNVFGTTGKSFYTFNAVTQAWEGANKNNAIVPGVGFIGTGKSSTATSITRAFSGTEGYHSGDISTTLAFNSDADIDNDWNLVGNPYPSGLDATTFISDNSGVIGSAIYLWSSDGSDYSSAQSDYATMNSAGVVNAGGGTPPTSATVASCQGFMVQATASANLNFTNSQRVATNNTFLRTKSDDWQRLWLGVQLNGEHNNELLIGFMPDAEEGQDIYDANKLSGHTHLSFYSLQKEKPMAIQGFPTLEEDRVIPIGLEAKTTGEYKFHINHLIDFAKENEIYLYDAETNLLTNLKEADYALNLEAGKYDNRFSLRLVVAKVTGIEDNLALKGVTVYAANQQLNINFVDAQSAKANIALYDISGKLLIAQSVENQLEVKIPVQYHGIFIVRIENGKGVITRRVYID